MALSGKTPLNRRRFVSAKRSPNTGTHTGTAVEGSRVGDNLVEAFEEMTRHLSGEIELQAHELLSDAHKRH